jgi:aryl-alcohol dehydrogenase-like predicted oxidoreductase
MEKRRLGDTGIEVSILGFGGFHLIEIPRGEASKLLNAYLDRGGSYIETAASYGDGISERKIGEALAHRRKDFTLATKTTERGRDGYLREVEKSLRNLKTDALDIVFMHAVQSVEEANRILGPGGALEGAVAAQRQGKIRFIGITAHGRPDGLLHSVRAHRFDVLMTGFNYFDRFNFPSIEGELLPLCRERGVGVLAMKALGDGYLYRSPTEALRYALSLDVVSVVAGMNSAAMLETDLAAAESFSPMSEAERERLYREAPELGDYVCRLCGRCAVEGFDPRSVFLLEGLYDRQMDSGRVEGSALYALRERLKFWFNQKDQARAEYARLPAKVDPAADYSARNALCPYGIDIDRKLKLAHAKLVDDGYI